MVCLDVRAYRAGDGISRRAKAHLVGEEALVVHAGQPPDGDGDPEDQDEIIRVGGVDRGGFVDVRHDVGGGGDLAREGGREGERERERDSLLILAAVNLACTAPLAS